MSTTTLKTLQRAVLASLLVLSVAACANVAPAPQVAASNLAAQDSVVEGGD